LWNIGAPATAGSTATATAAARGAKRFVKIALRVGAAVRRSGLAGAADLKFLHHLPQSHSGTSNRKCTGIIDLLVPLCFPKFVSASAATYSRTSEAAHQFLKKNIMDRDQVFRSAMRRSVCGIGIAALVLTSGAASAQSGGLFDKFFGFLRGDQKQAIPQSLAPAYAPPLDGRKGLSIVITPNLPSVGSGPVVAYCVRLCDGRYFPIPLSTGPPQAAPTKLCQALCPASQTRIYVGSDINRARTNSGSRYANLNTAFAYRKQLIADCTCNGKNVFGTAAIDIKADPTLRSGDLVAMQDGSARMAFPSRRSGSAIPQ
jgi:hypothetical protein